MKAHAKLSRDAEDDAEGDTEEQSDHGRIVVRAQVARHEDSRPYPDEDNDGGDEGTDDASDDDVVGPARNILRKSRGHVTEVLPSSLIQPLHNTCRYSRLGRVGGDV